VPERQEANLLHQRVNAIRPGGIPPRRSSGGALPSDRRPDRPDRPEAWTYPVLYPSWPEPGIATPNHILAALHGLRYLTASASPEAQASEKRPALPMSGKLVI
jgi:hypothetical protein